MAGATYCGIKAAGLDLAILFSEVPSNAAAVFTTSQVQAEPLRVTREHLSRGPVRAVVVNSGNANACTGSEGYADALETARLVANKLRLRRPEVLVASTGIIGVRLPMEKIRKGCEDIAIGRDGDHGFVEAIMTTDTRPKEIAVTFQVSGVPVTIGGAAKGAGMIHPNLATLLAFLTTDALVDRVFLQEALKRAADRSFNMVTIDGDTSTNDMVLLLANGVVGNPEIRANTPDGEVFQQALDYVTTHLAKEIARDGEGATKLIEVQVRGAASIAQARLAARAIAGSALVKAAVYGEDPNWGRILAAAGRSGAQVDARLADIGIGQLELMRAGQILAFDATVAAEQLKGSEVLIKVNLHLGDGEATAWGCDLTEQYVAINAKYTT